jgi:predicted AAA+ superfamily ATPase
VGRQNVIKLYPISAGELADNFGKMHLREELNNNLVFGSYPEIIAAKTFEEKRFLLSGIRDSYLYKDILELENIRNSKKILDLLKLVAYQIGKEVSLQELGSSLNMSKNTVEKYLDLLEKSFVLINVGGFSRNLRKEVYKTSRYYFYDNGIRNSVIDNLNFVDKRDDIGALWENYLFIERMKKREYQKIYANIYFWRTYDKKEIDLIEERGGKLYGYEFKFSGSKKAAAPEDWIKTYKNADFETINKSNYLEFIT